MEFTRTRTWLIARNEIIANIENFKLPVALVTMTFWLLGSAYILSFDYKQRWTNWSVNQAQQLDPIIGGSVRYDLVDGVFSHRIGIGRTPPMQPPQPFSALIKGMDGEVDRTVSVSQRIVFGVRQDEPATSALFDPPDTSFSIKLLVSLFALLFSLDTLTREKETGSLKAVLSQPIRRRDLILYKSLGASISLLAPFSISYLIEILYLHFAHGLLDHREAVIRALLIFALGALYGVVFIHIGLFISTIAARTKQAVTASFFTWVTIVLVMPNAAVLVAKLINPTPSYNQFNARLYEARQQNVRESSKENAAAKSSSGGSNFNHSPLSLFEIERQLTNNYLASKKAQNHQARLFAAVSPAGALTFGLSDLAGTGVDAYDSYLELFRLERDLLIEALESRSAHSAQEGDKLVQQANEVIATRRRQTEPLGSGLRSSIIAICSLTAWALLFGLAVGWRFKRYDVR